MTFLKIQAYIGESVEFLPREITTRHHLRRRHTQQRHLYKRIELFLEKCFHGFEHHREAKGLER